MNTVFCDTSGFYAAMVSDDRAHSKAATAWRALLLDRHRLVTTTYIILECVTLLQSRFGMEIAQRFHDTIKETVDIHCITASIHETAINDLFRQSRRKLSLVDCSSFAFMRHNHITTTFTYDAHFREHGFFQFAA